MAPLELKPRTGLDYTWPVFWATKLMSFPKKEKPLIY